MKKLFAAVSSLMLAVVILFSTAAFAEEAVINYYDENGNQITVNGMYYNSQGCPMYNSGCYYIDENGDKAYVGGLRACYYDADGNLIPGSYYYDENGKAVARPSSYPGGFGCGMYYYDANGDTVNGTYYYDDFGNRITPPATARRNAYGHGCGHCGW